MTTGTVTAKHCRYLSGQPRLTSKGAEGGGGGSRDEADLGVCEAPAARTSNASPDSATMIDSSGDPINGRGVGCWRLVSINPGKRVYVDDGTSETGQTQGAAATAGELYDGA